LLSLILISLVYSQTIDPNNICTSLNVTVMTKFFVDCTAEVSVISTLIVNPEDPELFVIGNCSLTCSVTFTYLKQFTACEELINNTQFVSLVANWTDRVTFIKAFDARCTALVDIDPPRIVLLGNNVQDPCPVLAKAFITEAIAYIINNCSVPDNLSLVNCTDRCFEALSILQFALHDCRDDFRFLDEVLYPALRRKMRVVNEVCDVRIQLASTAQDCIFFYERALAAIKLVCGSIQTNGSCSPLCQAYLMRSMGIIDRCASLFLSDGNVSGTLPPMDTNIINFLRAARTACHVDTKRLDVQVAVNETAVLITSEDSLSVNRPRTSFLFVIDAITRIWEWVTLRFDHYTDVIATKRLRVRLVFVHEFRARLDADTDPDFQDYGMDPNVDNVTNSYNLSDPAVADIDAITDLGSAVLYSSMGNLSLDATSFRRAFRTTIRFGPNRLSRILISHIVTNIFNGFGDAEVTVPGGVSYNFQLDNVPYTGNDTSFALELDIDTDVMEGFYVPNATDVYTDSNGGLSLQNSSEDHIEFNDTRRLRWKKIVYCDGGKEVVVRVRYVVSTEVPDDGFIVRKKLYVTFHISRSERCYKIFWDPTNDMETPTDVYNYPTGGNTGTTGGNTGQVDTDTNNIEKLVFSFFLLVAMLF